VLKTTTLMQFKCVGGAKNNETKTPREGGGRENKERRQGGEKRTHMKRTPEDLIGKNMWELPKGGIATNAY